MKKIKKLGSEFLAIMLSLLIAFSMGPTVHANTIDEIWVNGTNISIALANTVQCGNGTAVYEKATNTLTLNNAQITQMNVAEYGIENKSNNDFNIILQGSNSIDIPNTTGIFAYTEADMNFSGGGSLDIKAPQSISNHKNMTFDNVTITASSDVDGSIVSDGNIIIRNNADITCSGLYFGFNAGGSITITNSTVNATATGNNMNAFAITDKIIIEESSNVTATSYYPALFSKSDINISDSTINATSTADWGIWSKSNLTISGNSEVISKGLTGSIGAINSFSITPALDETVEVFLGTNEDNVTALEGSPFSAETDLKAFNVGANLYFHSKTHTHVASTEWSKDDINHWHECTANDNEKMDLASHTFGEWVMDTAATETTKGSKHKDCSVCEQRITEEIPMLTHTHVASTEWSKDNTNHWHECTANDGEKMDLATHTFGEWVIDTAATETTKGSKHKDCSVCEQRITEEIPMLTHTHVASTEWSKDDINHWHECTANDGEKMDLATHTFGEWIIDTAATETTKGSKHKDCSVCEQRITEEIPVIGVTPEKPIITAGAGAVYQISNGKDMTLTCSGKLEDLTGIYVDNKLIDSSHYTLKSGSTILTFKASYLDTLSVGEHVLRFQYKDGLFADTNFTITETPTKPNTPETGDTSHTMLYVGWIVVSSYVTCLGLKKKRINKI